MDFLIIFAAKYLYLVIVAVTVVALLIDKKAFARRSILKLALISLPFAFVIAKILSLFIYTSRPFVLENVKPLIDHAANNGFPSDHTLLAMTVSAVILIYNRKLGIVLIALSVVVGAARVLAKVHSPLDVIGSTIIAFSAVITSWIILERFKPASSLIDKILSKFKL